MTEKFYEELVKKANLNTTLHEILKKEFNPLEERLELLASLGEFTPKFIKEFIEETTPPKVNLKREVYNLENCIKSNGSALRVYISLERLNKILKQNNVENYDSLETENQFRFLRRCILRNYIEIQKNDKKSLDLGDKIKIILPPSSKKVKEYLLSAYYNKRNEIVPIFSEGVITGVDSPFYKIKILGIDKFQWVNKEYPKRDGPLSDVPHDEKYGLLNYLPEEIEFIPTTQEEGKILDKTADLIEDTISSLRTN